MFESLEIGTQAELTLAVTEERTAAHWGAGLLHVFATPEMVGLMEAAAVAAVDSLLPEGYNTVGTAVDVRHVAATPLGAQVWARAELVEIEGRRLTFRVEAHDQAGLIGEGFHRRHIIEVERFMERARNRIS